MLHALAYANDAPMPPDGETEDAADPVFAVIEAHRAAWEAHIPFFDAWNNASGGTAAAAEAAGRDAFAREKEAWPAVLQTQPTTPGGLLALAKYLPGAIVNRWCEDAGTDPTKCLVLLCDAIQAQAALPDCDLSACSVSDLARLYETWESVFHHISAVGSIPCMFDETRNFNAAGELMDREYNRALHFLEVIAGEAVKRTQKNVYEREQRLCVLVRNEMNTTGLPASRSLMVEIAKSAEN